MFTKRSGDFSWGEIYLEDVIKYSTTRKVIDKPVDWDLSLTESYVVFDDNSVIALWKENVGYHEDYIVAELRLGELKEKG